MGLTPAEFKATKQLVWLEESAFYAETATRAFKSVGDEGMATNMHLEAALQALGMLVQFSSLVCILTCV